MTGRITWRAVPLFLNLLLLPAVVHAQSAISGVVKDASGAVLPGVTVEASSDALIERSRTAVTNGEGRFLIYDLRPGAYVVTFTLAGFQTLRRDGIQLPSEFTATVDAELRVGALAESITVTGAAPLVDVRSAVHTQVLDREIMDALPTGRTFQGLGQLVVGINLNLPDTGGARGMQQTYLSTHSMSAANNTVMVDGMLVNGLCADGAVQNYFNDAMNQELSYQTASIGAETQGGGVRLNMVPREGGNRFSGDTKASFRPGDWQADNVGARLIAKGLPAGSGNATDRIIDATVAEGGPIKRDKLWFFASGRYFSVNNFIANTFFRDGSRGLDDQFIRSAQARLTWQVSPKNKFSAMHDEVDKFRGHDMQSLYVPEEASSYWGSPAYHTQQAKWTSTITNRFLFEGGYSSNIEAYTIRYQPTGISKPRGTPDWLAGASRVEDDLGGRKSATFGEIERSPARFNLQTSLSYVTGSHHVKVGGQYQWGYYWKTDTQNADLEQHYRSNSTGVRFTVPDTVLIENTPLVYGERLNRDFGIYAQDSWTIKRLTINGGLRMDQIKAQVYASSSPAGRFVPARTFAEIQDLPYWTNFAPRFTAVYDLFGNSKTALKYSANRYNRPYTTTIAANYNPLRPEQRSLQWRDMNGDDIAQGERGCAPYPSVGCEINFSSLPENFGIAALNQFGDYERLYNVDQGIEIQHELLRRLSMTASYFKGGFRRWSTTVNQSWVFNGPPEQNPNYVAYTLYNPLTGAPIIAYGRTAAAQAAPVRNLDQKDPTRERLYSAFNIEFRARPGRGAQLFGGVSMEQQQDVNCYAADDPNRLRFCDELQLDGGRQVPWIAHYKLSGSMPVRWGVQVSAAYQNVQPNNWINQGQTLEQRIIATRGATRYPTTCPAPCPAGEIILPSNIFNQATLTLALEPAATLRQERVQQLDVKVSKVFRYGRYTFSPQFEMFNVFNSDTIVSYVSTNVLNRAYLQPNSIVQPRLTGVGAQVRW